MPQRRRCQTVVEKEHRLALASPPCARTSCACRRQVNLVIYEYIMQGRLYSVLITSTFRVQSNVVKIKYNMKIWFIGVKICLLYIFKTYLVVQVSCEIIFLFLNMFDDFENIKKQTDEAVSLISLTTLSMYQK